jgi:K+-transporting ATPase KdpF subunit
MRQLDARDRLHLRLRQALEEQPMVIEYVLGGAVTFGLLVYLVYALLRPERF